ncbi:WD_REPEATS_REGION domain-containing protein, partial [Haematococcus lacustris]
MVKAYLRYEPAATFGIITSGAQPCYDTSGKLLITAALESVVVWNIKQASQVAVLTPSNSSEASSSTASSKAQPEVTCITRAPGSSALIAVGYGDGSPGLQVRLWDLTSKDCLVTLQGHKSGVSCLRFSADGALLASGSKDTDLVVWDVAGEAGLFRLRGHKDQITALCVVWVRFELLLELPGHHGEVWCCAVSSRGDFFVTGSHDRSLRRWQRSAESFFVEEEKEKRLESLFEADLEQQPQPGGERQPGGGEAEQGGVASA